MSEENKKIALAFYEKVLNEFDPATAVAERGSLPAGASIKSTEVAVYRLGSTRLAAADNKPAMAMAMATNFQRSRRY